MGPASRAEYVRERRQNESSNEGFDLHTFEVTNQNLPFDTPEREVKGSYGYEPRKRDFKEKSGHRANFQRYEWHALFDYTASFGDKSGIFSIRAH